jgi:hypothetical protein
MYIALCEGPHKAHIYISYNQRHIECVTYIVHEVDIVLPSNYT